jgi:hypothetical protein
MLTPETRVVPNLGEVSGKVLDGEAIIINVSTGRYYSMDGVGALAWSLLEAGPTAGEIARSIAALHEVPDDAALADVLRLLGELLEEGLVVVGDAGVAPAGPAPAPPAAGRAAYSPPVLNVYTDMADLLALDPPMPMLADIPKGSSTGEA